MHYSKALSQSGVNFVAGPWCVSVAEWFHRHGVVWSGTPSELAAQLSAAGVKGDGDAALIDPAAVVSELEANAETLRGRGVDVWVERSRDRVRSVTLRANGAEPANVKEEEEFAVHQSETPVSDILDAVVNDSYDASVAENVKSEAGEIADQSEFTLASSNEDADAPSEFAMLDSLSERKRSLLPIGVAALIALLALVLILFFAVNKNGAFASPVGQQAGAGADGSESSSADDWQITVPSETTSATNAKRTSEARGGVSASRTAGVTEKRSADPEIEKLTDDAVNKRIAASQFELGRRYAEGRGVSADKSAAYAWLVVALNNGETRSEVALQSLAPRMSTIDIQKIRIRLGNWYTQGRGVSKDLVAAHKWFALAEVAGSAEGTIRKKALEAEMSPEQIKDAEESTTAWLSRH
jgi:hypothetical protein